MDQQTPTRLIGVYNAYGGIVGELKYLNERTESEIRASSGQEPCVLAQYADGSLGMFLDRAELAMVKGDVAKFEGIVRARPRLFF